MLNDGDTDVHDECAWVAVIRREVVKHRMQSVTEEFNTHCLEFWEVGGWEVGLVNDGR